MKILKGIVLIFSIFVLFGVDKANAQLPPQPPREGQIFTCHTGKECQWFKVSYDDKRIYGIQPSQSSVQFYNEQNTKDKICQIRNYAYHPGAVEYRTFNQWSTVNGEYHVEWSPALDNWRFYKAVGVSYLDYIVCAKDPAPPAAPSVNIYASPEVVSWGNTTEITWESQNTVSCEASGDWSGPKNTWGVEDSTAFWYGSKTFHITCRSANGQIAEDEVTARLDFIPTAPLISWCAFPTGNVQNGGWYEIGACASDPDGDLVRIDVYRSVNGVLSNFDIWIGGGETGSTHRDMYENGPLTVTYSAIARDVYGRTSQLISRNVVIDGPVVPVVNAPTIEWTKKPVTANNATAYEIEARGADINGDLTNVSIDKGSTPFAYAGGGDGYSNLSGNTSTDNGPATITYRAQSRDATGLTSPFIYHTVTVGGTAPSTYVTATPECIAPGGGISITASALGTGISSNVLEKDTNGDGVYGAISQRPDAGVSVVTVYVPTGETSSRYDFRLNINNGQTYSDVESVAISYNCSEGNPPTTGTFCQQFPWLCPTPPPRTQYEFRVYKGGTGTGNVRGTNIDCGMTCYRSPVYSGETYILSAFPDANSTFAGWSGACSGSDPNRCVINVTGNTSVTATFNSNTGLPPGTCRPLTATDGPFSVAIFQQLNQEYANVSWNTYGSQYCVPSWSIGSLPTATGGRIEMLTSNSGWLLFCWNPGVWSWYNQPPPNSQYGVNVTCDPLPPTTPPPPPNYTITVSKTGEGTVYGTGISCGTICSTSVVSGGTNILTAIATPGWTFTGWSDSSCPGIVPCTVVADANKTITATFTQVTTGGTTCLDPMASNYRSQGTCTYAGSFNLNASPTYVEVVNEPSYYGKTSVPINVSVQALSGFTDPITLSVDPSSVPPGSGMTFSFSNKPYTGIPSATFTHDGTSYSSGGSAIVPVMVRFESPLTRRQYTVRIVGTGGGKTASVSFDLFIRPPQTIEEI